MNNTMAVDAEIGHFIFGQFIGLGSMGGVAGHAILCYRRMLLDKGAAFVGMTSITEQVYGFSLDHIL